MEREMLIAILESHKLWLANDPSGQRANLRGADLRGADLREVEVRGANLREADLREANLCEANLCGAELRGADLREVDLREVDLRGANLREANLREANLRGANLREADLREADLRGADLREVDLRGTGVVRVYMSRWEITVYPGGIVAIGCERHSIDDWLAQPSHNVYGYNVTLDEYAQVKAIVLAILGNSDRRLEVTPAQP